MALAATFRSQVDSTAAGTSYSSASGAFTPAANSLMVALVASRGDTTSASGVSGNGATYSNLGGVNVQGSVARIDVWAADSGASPTSGEVTASGWGSNRTGCHIHVIEVTGADLSGGVAAAIINIVSGTGAAATASSATLAAASNANNRPMAGNIHIGNEATTPRTNWTELSDGSFGSPNSGFETQWRSDTFETTASASWTTSSNWTILAFEIVAAGSSTTTLPALAGVIGFTGGAATLPWTMPAGAGAISMTGAAATFVNVLRINAVEVGHLTIAGGAVLTPWTLGTAAGSIGFTGSAADFINVLRINAADVGHVDFAGGGTTLAHTLAAGGNVIAFNGSASALAIAQVLAANAGAIGLTGADAALIANAILAAGSGLLVITGGAAGLSVELNIIPFGGNHEPRIPFGFGVGMTTGY